MQPRLPVVNVEHGCSCVPVGGAPPASSGAERCALPDVDVTPRTTKQRAPRNGHSAAKLPSTERKRKAEPASGGVTSQTLPSPQPKPLERNTPEPSLPTVRSAPPRRQGKTAIQKLQSKGGRPTKKTPPCWRKNAKDDLPLVAELFGEDLRDVAMPASGGSVPSSWLDYNSCFALLEERGISPSRIDVLEVYAGSGNFIAACREAGLWVGPPSTSMPRIRMVAGTVGIYCCPSGGACFGPFLLCVSQDGSTLVSHPPSGLLLRSPGRTVWQFVCGS